MPEQDDDQPIDQPIELNISAEKIRDIVLKVREFDLTEFPDDPDPGSDPDEPADPDLVLDEGEDPTESELRDMIDDLNDDEVVDLIALAWVGRGDFSRAEWPEARTLARERHGAKSSGYLMGMPTLSEYLDEGLAALGHAGPDADED
jgi:hypothetical protein